MKKSNVFAIALAFTLAIAGTAGAADVNIAPGLVTWKAQDDASVLRISGPDGVVQDLTFEPGETPTFGLIDKAGDSIKDGQYQWELFLSVTAPDGISPKIDALRARGLDREGAELLPAPTEKLSGSFKVWNGDFVLPDLVEDANKDQVILDDLIVDGSICAGLDCVNGESFGFDTLRLKENNLRIKAQDTSNSASFPTNDWQITFNDSSNGGANKYSIDDIDGGRTPFTIEAGAPSHSLYVDDGGRIGFGTSTPVVNLHVVSGNTPTLRLEQNGSSGFTPQTWDVAGNETNFFVRDATNGSTLPFRIRPSAPSNSIFVDTDGDVGLSTSSPQAAVHIVRASGGAQLRLEATAADPELRLVSTASSQEWQFKVQDSNGFFVVTRDPGGGSAPFKVSPLVGANVLVVGTAGGANRVGINRPDASGTLHPLHVGTTASDGNGAHVTAAGVWTNGSSRKNKKDITRLAAEDALATLKGLEPVRYRGKVQDDEEYLGFIAEDVPDLVAMNDREGLASMDIVAVLTRVLQVQQERIDQLEAELQQLKKPAE